MKSKSEFQKILDSIYAKKQTKRPPLSIADETVILKGTMPFINFTSGLHSATAKDYKSVSSYKSWAQKFPFYDPASSNYQSCQSRSGSEPTKNIDFNFLLQFEKKRPKDEPTISFKNLNSAEVFAWMYFEKKVENWPRNLTFSRLKKVYKTLALRFHPDHNSGVCSEFLTLKESFQTLSKKF